MLACPVTGRRWCEPPLSLRADGDALARLYSIQLSIAYTPFLILLRFYRADTAVSAAAAAAVLPLSHTYPASIRTL